jgi:hypothetical protein
MNKSLAVLAVALTILCALFLSVFVPSSEGSDENKFRKVEKSIPNQYIVIFKTSVRGKRLLSDPDRAGCQRLRHRYGNLANA